MVAANPSSPGIGGYELPTASDGVGLDAATTRSRANRVRFVLTDNDGTLTDGRVYYSAQGEELKCYSLRDGHGVELLRNAGGGTAIITREPSAIARRRAEKLRMPHVFTGVQDKADALPEILRVLGARLDEVAYIGDDLNDLRIAERVATAGLTAAPADAHPLVKGLAHFVAPAPGGHGAFREFAEWLLAWRGAAIR